MLTSLLFHHSDQPFRIFLLVPESFSEIEKRKMIDSLSPWAPELEFVSVSEHGLSGLKDTGYRFISTVTYYRLLMTSLLPHTITRALYLDSDIIINDRILDLLYTDISDYAFAAVPDPWENFKSSVRGKIHLKENAHYFNGGVLLLNLERWRSEKIGSRALEFVLSNPQSVTFHDQCALNHIIQGNFYVLNKRWNFQVGHVKSFSEYKFPSSARTQFSHAAIIHFTGDPKPWNFECTHPMKNQYFNYLKHTAWRDFVETDRTPRKMVKKFIRTYFPSATSGVEAAYRFGKRILGT
jgi:lipopolysaccharide biosynthesis glycosyltransferase